MPNSETQGAVGNLIFVSYRRADTAVHTLALRLEFETRFRAVQVFVDTHTIQAGDKWPDEIANAMSIAKVVVPVIGVSWAGSEVGNRRIDDPDDWVHKEISLALAQSHERILPILVNGAPALRRGDLPKPLQDLADIQPIKIEVTEWDQGIENLVGILKSKFGLESKQTTFRFPKPDKVIAKTIPIPWSVLETDVANSLPEWRIEFSDDPDKLHYKRVELVRDFEFKSFEDAMAFMATVSKFASENDHHPRWMNVWRTVTVWLSTWDAGHRITVLDTQLARFFERKYREYKQSN
jgi:pterin-4a-carbinolamine dehydratase